MLTLNLSNIFKARNITKPYAFLIKAGISHNLATRLVNHKVESMQFRHIELLCLLLNCEPNDLFHWIPDKSVMISEKHSLHKLKKAPFNDNISAIAQLSFKQLQVLSEKIEEIKSTVDE